MPIHSLPSGLITTLGTTSQKVSSMQVNLTGPQIYKTHDYSDLKLWPLVCVSSHWEQVKILPVTDTAGNRYCR